MNAWQNMYNKLEKVGEQMLESLPGLEANIYRERATPDIHMILERKTKFLYIFTNTEQIARIYQTWKSNDQFIMDFPYFLEEEMREKVKSAFEKVKKSNPKQLFKIMGD